MPKAKRNRRVKADSGSRWSGRFAQKIDPLALRFTSSISFDWRLYLHDIMGSLAHARMLRKIGLLSQGELKRIAGGLQSILREIEAGRFRFREDLEDIHRNVEAALIKKIGPVGGKLHTARSRNDQVALDLRLYARDQTKELHAAIVDLEQVLLKKGKESIDILMPGYTHLQRAQPVLFSHHLLAYIEMLERDRSRLIDAYERMNILPLGSGALAGTTFPLDREFVARELGFKGVTRNSLDAVSDRDFAIELASACSLLMMHLSRLSEELVLWSSAEFDFVKLPESFCTGSSMMPQKMNPDVPELVRGKTGRVYGHLFSLLTLMKGLPLTYNKDLQEDKEPFFDLFNTALNSVRVTAKMINGLVPNRKRMEACAGDGFLLATDLADWLVRKGIDFRSAHEVTARIVRYALEEGKDLKDLSFQELKKFSSKLTPEVLKVFETRRAVDHRKVIGGTAKVNVLREIERLRKVLGRASFSIQE